MKKIKCLNSLHLKIIAAAFMLLDHMWSTIAPDQMWLTAAGRIAFPIFAFQIAEGFYYTKNRKKYFFRMLIFAAISEIPFNLIAGGGMIYPIHQNVMFTFCISILIMMLLEKAKAKNMTVFIIAAIITVPLSFLIGFITFVDYFGYGIWTVLIFYLFRGVKFGQIAELAGIVYINWFMIGGLVYYVPLFGHQIEIPEQGFAILALIPIWLYNGKKGYSGKAAQYFFYIFYPAHMLILYILEHIMY